MKKFLFVLYSLLLGVTANPFSVQGAMVIVPSCDIYPTYNRIIGNVFSLRTTEYINGYLVVHLTFRASSENRDFYLYGYLFKDSNCMFLDGTNGLKISIPDGVTNISLRFSDDNSFLFYNDESNTPLECEHCKVVLMPGDQPPYKFQLYLNADFSSAEMETKLYTVKDPNFVERNAPVLLIPGTLGTDLYRGNELLWLDAARLVITNNDRFMDPLGFDENGNPLDTSITPGGVLEMPSEGFDYSKAFIDDLLSKGYKRNENLFLFSYDWRKDISENADGPLKNFIDDLLTRAHITKIDVVAHSQGGLVIKRLLYDHPEYKDKINKLILVGTPNLGSPKSFKILTEGDALGVKLRAVLGLDPSEVKRIAENMPSVYEMLPSQEYFNHYQGYWGTVDRRLLKSNEEIIYNYDQTKQKLKDAGYNSMLLDNNNTFHSFGYDQFDFTGSGIQVYNVVGCQTPTYSGVIQRSFQRDKVLWEPGDETVPLKSATNLVNVNTYYSLDAEHSTMLTQEGIRQTLINVITGSDLPQTHITQDPTQCHFNGEEVSLHSPVDLHVYDSNGRHVGPTSEGGFDSEIPGVGYETIGEEKFAFLPEGLQYHLVLNATDSGKFSLYSSQVKEGIEQNTVYFDSVPITASSTGQVDLSVPPENRKIKFDYDGDGVFEQNLESSSILNNFQSLDYVSPSTTPTFLGLMGQAGYYRSDVAVTLNAADPVIPGHEDETSGILNTQYKLDEGSWQNYSSTTPIAVTGEGNHTLEFFSTDRAGNNEEPQSIMFTIDKTAPELSMQFSPGVQDLAFTGSDNVSTASKLSVVDSGNAVTVEDEAGNVTKLSFNQKNRKKSLKAEMASLSYNGQVVDINRNNLKFEWQFDKQGSLVQLQQTAKSKRDFNVSADYRKGRTTVEGQDETGRIKKTVPGLSLLEVTTVRGDLAWSIQ